MLRAILIVIAIVLALPSLGFQDRNKKRQQRITGGESGWVPSKESLLYKYTRSLAEIDRVEISEVSFGRTADSKAYETKVINSVTLKGSEAARFMAIWRNLNSGVGAGCFSPAYLVKLYSGEVLLVGSTICFHCHNLTLPVGESSESSEIHPFDADGPTGRKLLKAIQDALAKSSTPLSPTSTCSGLAVSGFSLLSFVGELLMRNVEMFVWCERNLRWCSRCS